MSVEIHQPEIEALIQQRMASGAFHDVEDLLLHALKSAPPPPAPSAPSEEETGLAEICAMVNSLAQDIDFSRNPSIGRRLNVS